MTGWSDKPHDQRAERGRSERVLVIGAVIIFLVVGGILIGLIYGWPSLISGLLCLAPGVGALVLLWLLLRFLEWLLKRSESDGKW